MPPSIHPVHLVTVLRQKSLTPAIIFLTSRRSCDEALQAFEHATDPLPPARQESITAVLDEVTATYPSVHDHPLRKMVTTCGVAAHHARHLPSWKIAIEELMRRGCLDAVFATPTLAAGVDFPARTVVQRRRRGTRVASALRWRSSRKEGVQRGGRPRRRLSPSSSADDRARSGRWRSPRPGPL